jgi:CxxC motif-containing protein (DUF1111 family)
MKRALRNALLNIAPGIVAMVACTHASEGGGPSASDSESAIGVLSSARDPGPRAGSPGAGDFFPTLNAVEQASFAQARDRFQEVDSVSGTLPGEPGAGLGPTFNGNSCAMCHAQPAVGGSSPGAHSPQHPTPNPQIALATLDGATNTVPPFITADGPVREARFVFASGKHPSTDGGVHALFTIRGRTDAPGCQLAQPDFARELAEANAVFRIPTPLFGLGLVENTPDATLAANLASDPAVKRDLGIAGRLNTSGNDGTVTRFGWKGQNKSLLVFAGEAYNVEQGVSNENFPNERSAVAGCVFNTTPEDSTALQSPNGGVATGTASDTSSDLVNFALFIRLSAPPAPGALSDAAARGERIFESAGCSTCHSPSLTTAASPYTGMSAVTYHPFSDFALHHMGVELADGILQGVATEDEFRTAPLWGVGQRLFFLHDGRTSDLAKAIEAHASPGSEANKVVRHFNALGPADQGAILEFLRAL